MNYKHGLKNTRLYRIWLQIKNRCFNSNTDRYRDYGARGITVCDEWRNDFKAFYDWAMNNGYSDELTIDRIDNDGNYEPSNCRWVSVKVQNRNTRSNHLITYKGETRCVADWADITGLSRACICDRIKYGWSVERILETPLREHKIYKNSRRIIQGELQC